MKALSWALFVAYLLILLWLVLFKFSYDPLAVIRDFQTRSLNLIPFARTHTSEMIWNKVAVIFAFSLAVELIQVALAIGVADITDIIMNTLGGSLGLAGYLAVSK